MIARQVQVERIAKTTIFLTVALAALSFVTGIGDALSIALGGAVSWANLRLIRMLVSRLMTPGLAGKSFSQLVTIKLLLLIALVAVALKRLPIDAVWFLIGGGALFAAIVLEVLVLGERIEEPEGQASEGS
jgi:hypothetical protein